MVFKYKCNVFGLKKTWIWGTPGQRFGQQCIKINGINEINEIKVKAGLNLGRNKI
jgi:hypothetical protein